MPETTTTDKAKLIWDFLVSKIGNSYGAAALMGNLYAESALQPTNLQNTYEKKLGMSDAEYTAAVDNGTYTNFVRDAAGYGLAQWTYWSRKQNLLEFAQTAHQSIGDLQMQLDFLWKEIQSYKSVLAALTSAKEVRAASDVVLKSYENPADQSEAVQKKRASYGQSYYDKYAKSEVTTVQQPTTGTPTGLYANRVIEVAIGELGYKEKKSNSQLDDKTANAGSGNYTKYARDFDQKYPNWYNGKKNGFAWCDMFVDWCFLTAYGYANALKLLCQPEKSAGAGCTYSLRYYKNKGQYVSKNPLPGDQIFFGTSLDNVTHTGIVEKVSGSTVYTIEGNTSDMVARRSYALSNSRIVGYGRPKYDSGTDTTPIPQSEETTPSTQPEAGIKVGDHVRIVNSGNTTATYYKGQAIPGWVASRDWIVRSVSGDRVVIDKSVDGKYSICSPISDKFLKVVSTSASDTVAFASYKVRVTATVLNIRSGPGTDNSRVGSIADKGVYTIVAEADGKGATKWGRLQSGAGWISLDYTVKV